MDIDVRDITPHLLAEQSSAREDFNVWLTVIKPNMVVENTLCVMVAPMWQVNQYFGEHGIIARKSLSHYQHSFNKLWEDEQAWRNKVRELGLDVTRWRINPFAPGETKTITVSSLKASDTAGEVTGATYTLKEQLPTFSQFLQVVPTDHLAAQPVLAKNVPGLAFNYRNGEVPGVDAMGGLDARRAPRLAVG